jgi:hypothetical protein
MVSSLFDCTVWDVSMSEVGDLLTSARRLDQARVMDLRLLVERAHWNEGLLRKPTLPYETDLERGGALRRCATCRSAFSWLAGSDGLVRASRRTTGHGL